MMLIHALLSHYRRHPVQALFLLTGIIVANVLLTGTLLINAQSRASYAEGEQFLNAAPAGEIRHSDRGQNIDERDYIQLRRLGFDNVTPLLREVVQTADGRILELAGIDVLAMPRSGRGISFSEGNTSNNISFAGFAFAPYQLWVAPARLQQLGATAGERLRLSSDQMLPPLVAAGDQQLGHRLLIDIGALQSLAGKPGELSSLLVFPDSPGRLTQLRESLPAHLRFIASNDSPDPAELTRSFHLNLAAMGLLAFVVGIFLIYNALAFSYTDRRDLIRKLRLAGVGKTGLAGMLLLELFLFLLVGTLAGSWLGAQMAAWLLPGVGRTLAQLYGVYIAYPDGLVPSGIWLPLLMTFLAAGLCVLFPLREALNAPMLERHQAGWQQATVQRRDRLLAWSGVLLLLISALAGFLAQHLWVALAGMACLLLGAALLLPAVLRTLIGALERAIPPQKARLAWLLADSRWLLGPASLALMAMTLALVANSGLNTMIFSFRAATDDWLSQRLAADLYLRRPPDAAELQSWLATEMPELQLAERFSENITRENPAGIPVTLQAISLHNGERFRDTVKLVAGERDAAGKFHNGEGVYISERAWRIDGWQPGDSVQLCDAHTAVPVLGVYRDYGNPRSQWMLSKRLFKACWPEQLATGLSISGPPGSDWDRIRSTVVERFDLDDDEIINQAELKQVGMAVFDRTFTVTQALNTLTLLVAAIGIFCAISAIHHHRVSQQALLTSLGLTRRERGSLLMLQWGMLGLLCMVLVWPFGTALAGYLAAVVTPTAFGWSFSLQPEWRHYLVLAALAAGCLMLAVILPSLRLLTTSPAAMLRQQNV
ncbi:MAG: FtsX-like permease family protein [Xanthomonadales bacterium]|nr:FtsX-like permease family protein [Xanthomonadales bacterium]